MMRDRSNYTPSNVSDPSNFQDRRLNIDYGYIIATINPNAGTEEENSTQRYLFLIKKDMMTASPDVEPAIMPLDHPAEELAATFGTPNDLVGQRVQLLYVGEDWRGGTARLAHPRDIEPRPQLTETPNRGFRYAIAGQTGGE